MLQYPNRDLYQLYLERIAQEPFSESLPDITKKSTLENMNFALNLCEKWEHCLDIGGSNGHYLAALAGKFKHATLVEVEKLPAHDVLPLSFKNIKVVQSYIEQYRPEIKADFILLADVYEHIPDISAFTKQLYSLQPAGGVVYIMTPNPVFCGPAPESGTYHTRHKHGHIKHYTVDEIKRTMKAAGYEHELTIYEETPLRQMIKRIVFALARRHKNWKGHFPLSLLRPLLKLTYHLAAPALEWWVYRSERKHNNPLTTITHNLVFKKPYEQT